MNSERLSFISWGSSFTSKWWVLRRFSNQHNHPVFFMKPTRCVATTGANLWFINKVCYIYRSNLIHQHIDLFSYQTKAIAGMPELVVCQRAIITWTDHHQIRIEHDTIWLICLWSMCCVPLLILTGTQHLVRWDGACDWIDWTALPLLFYAVLDNPRLLVWLTLTGVVSFAYPRSYTHWTHLAINMRPHQPP